MTMRVNTLQPYEPFRFQHAAFHLTLLGWRQNRTSTKIAPAKSRAEIGPFGSLDRLFYILKQVRLTPSQPGHVGQNNFVSSLEDRRHQTRVGMDGSRAFRYILILSVAHSRSFSQPPRHVLSSLSLPSLSAPSPRSLGRTVEI
jgi:hypothetical protein